MAHALPERFAFSGRFRKVDKEVIEDDCDPAVKDAALNGAAQRDDGVTDKALDQLASKQINRAALKVAAVAG